MPSAPKASIGSGSNAERDGAAAKEAGAEVGAELAQRKPRERVAGEDPASAPTDAEQRRFAR